MKKIGWILVMVSLLTLVLPVASFAQMTVFDPQAFEKLVQEYAQLKELYDNAQKQLDQAKQMVSDAEGHYGFGSFENGLSDLKNREWSPDNWRKALKGLSGGNKQRYQQLVDEYKEKNPTLSESDYKKGESDANASMYQNEIKVNQASTVNASYAFNDIKQHLVNVHDISNKIEQAKNTKAAIDLNTRLNAELAYISIQELKMLTLINQQMAASQSNTISSETENAKFNALPDQ